MADKTSRKSSQRTRLSISNNKESANTLAASCSTDSAAISTATILTASHELSPNRKKRKSTNLSLSLKEPVATSSFASKSTNINISKSESSLVNKSEEDELEEEEAKSTKPKKKDKKRKLTSSSSLITNSNVTSSFDLNENSVVTPKTRKSFESKSESERNAKSKAIEALNTSLKSKQLSSALSTTQSTKSEESDLLSKENKVSRSSLTNSVELGSQEGDKKKAAREIDQGKNGDQKTEQEENDQDDLAHNDEEDEEEEEEEEKDNKKRFTNLKRRRLSSNEAKNKHTSVVKSTSRHRRRLLDKTKQSQEDSETEAIVIDKNDQDDDEIDQDDNLIEIEQQEDPEETEEEYHYQNKLRRPSSSKSASSVQSDKHNSSIEYTSHKKQKTSPANSQASKSSKKSKLESESINLKYQQSKKETGACTSKPSTSTSSTHLASSRRGAAATSLTQSSTADNSYHLDTQTSNLDSIEVASTSKRSSANIQASTNLEVGNNNTLTPGSSLLSKFRSQTKSFSNMNQDNNQKNVPKQSSNSKSTSSINASTAATAAASAAAMASLINTTSGFGNQPSAASSAAGIGLIESADSSDNDTTTAEFSRLTDLLQARGLPTHIVNAFGSKVQQFLHRTMSSGITSRSSQLVNSLQQHDESVKLTALSELCQLLVMGNEDTLVGFPIKQAVPLLLQCMRSESENYDLMNHACRALTYMMESLPRSSSIIAEGIGVFLEKLQVIQCMDVAEQSLTALEILSRRHSKQILNATQSGSISACLTYIDFFSITAQRNALQITANCCQNVIKDEFVHIQSSLPILSQRLAHSDKKSVESVCTVFARLVENFQRDRLILKEIASHNVLTNMQQLLVAQPSVVSPSIFVTVLHTIYLMCANCNELAIELLENNIANTFRQLLIGSKFNNESTDIKSEELQLNNQQDTIEILSSRSPQELYEIVSIIGEIMPRLPQTGLFSIDEVLRKTSLANQNEHVLWQWKDERDVWRPYTPVDSRIIEAAFSQEEDECILNTMGRTYVLDFNSMLQINEDTGTTRPIARKVLNNQPSTTSQASTTTSTTLSSTNNVNTNNTNEVATNKQNDTTNVKDEDNRLRYLEKNPKVYAQFVSSLFSILYEVYNSSAGPAIKHRSLRAILRMIYYSSNSSSDKKKIDVDDVTLIINSANSENNNNVLYNLLKSLPISSHIASMLASTDPKIIVSALQICEILMQKMPDVFSVYFHREGVIHQIDKLIETGSESVSKVAAAASNEINKIISPTKTSTNNESAAATSASSSRTNDQNQRKTRSSTAAAAAAAAAATTTNTGVTTSSLETSSAKRKIRTSQASKTASSSTAPAPAPPSESNAAQQASLTSSTSKYFRNIITKMHGSNSNPNSNQTLATASNTSNKSNSSFQAFSLVTPQASSNTPTVNSRLTGTAVPSLSSSSSYYNNNTHNYLSQTTSSIQRNASSNNNEVSIFGRGEPPSSASLWGQLKSSNNSTVTNPASNPTSSLSSYSNLIPFSSTSSSRRKTPSHYNPLQSQNLIHLNMNPIVSLQQQQQLSSIDYNLINQNKEKVRQWIYDHAKKFRETYFSQNQSTANENNTDLVVKDNKPLDLVFNSGLNVLKRLKEVVNQLDFSENNKEINLTVTGLDSVNTTYLISLKEISNILNETDISSFEMIHSGLIEKLAAFLSVNDDADLNLEKKLIQLTRLTHQTLHSTINPVYLNDIETIFKNESKILRCKQFMNVFSNLPLSFHNGDTSSDINKNTTISLFSILLLKLHNCVNQLEQFAVRVHDVPTSVGYGKTAAIKFFNTHQFKCLLRRHPSCSTTPTPTNTPSSKSQAGAKSVKSTTHSNVSQWKGGPVKVDPLAAVSTIEKYLLCRGLHRPSIPPPSTSVGVTSSSFLSQSLPTSSLSQTGKSAKSSTKSKSPTSRLFMFKAAAEMASDRFKSRKTKQTIKTTSDISTTAAATSFVTKSASSAPVSIKKVQKSSKRESALTSKLAKTDKSKVIKIKKPKKSKSMNSSATSSIASSSTAAASTSSKSARIDKRGKGKSAGSKSLIDLASKSFNQDLIEENEEDLEEEQDEFGELIEESIENDEYEFNEDIDISNDDNEQILDLEDDEDEVKDDDDEDDEEDEEELDDDTYLENRIAEDQIDEEEEGSEENDLDEDEDDDDDDDDDGDIESAMNAILGANSARSGGGSGSFKNFYLTSFTSANSSTPLPKFELLINDHVLPSNMSIYQAIKLYSAPNNNAGNNNKIASEDLDDIESSLLNNAIWSKVHMIHYRLAQPLTQTTSQTVATSNSKTTELDSSKRTTRNSKQSASTKTANKSNKSKTLNKTIDLDSPRAEASCSEATNSSFLETDNSINASEEALPSNINTNISSTVFFNSLTIKWPAKNNLTLHDQSLEVISLLRLLNALNRNWYLLYHDMFSFESLLTSSSIGIFSLSQKGTTTDSNQLAPISTSFLIASEQFVNTKLTAKANRQLQDPLVIMTGHLPKWLPELMKTCPFLFPFKTRLMYFYVSSLDRDRAMQKLIDMNADLFQADTNSTNNNNNDRFVPKLEKKKRTIIRANDLIKQADTILNEFAVNNSGTSSSGYESSLSTYSHHKPALLEIQYENEVGTGLGPTLEFYALVSLEIQKCDYDMWRGEKMNLSSAGGQNQNQLFYFSPNGLFPAPVCTVSSNTKQNTKQQAHLTKLKTKFKFLGKFFAKAIMDFRVVDIQLSYVFYKWLIDPNSICADDIKYIDTQLYKSIESLKDYLRKRRNLMAKAYMLKENIDESLKPILNELNELEKTVLDLDLDFTLPGYNHIELKKGGKDIIVNLENLEEYLKLIVEWTLITGVEKQLEAFRDGFESILSISCLQQFYPEELERLFCGSGFHEWNIKLLSECTRCDHGYTHESTAVKYLFEIMCSFNSDEQRQFLQFITGSPRLPVGGLRSLVPPLTIVRKSVEGASSSSTVNADSYLPSVMTCVNYLKLPDYSSLDAMKDKLFKAMKDGQLSFHLS